MGNDPTALLARMVPGFSAPNQSLSGASETFRGRGLLVMVDGVPRNTPLRDVSRILSLIDLNSVDRIEVTSGASSLYGPGATGGTINIVTRSGENAGSAPVVTMDTRLKAYTEDPSASLRSELSLGVSQDLGTFDYAFTLSGSTSNRTFGGDGAELPSDPVLGQGGLDRADNLTGSLTLGLDLAEGRRLEYGFEAVHYTQAPDHFSAYSADGVTQDPTAPYTGDDVTERSTYHRLTYSDDTLAIGALNVTLSHADIEKGFGYTPYGSYNSQVYYSGDPQNPVADFNQTRLFTQRTALALALAVDTPLDFAGLAGAALTWGFDWSFDKTHQALANGADAIAPMKQTTRAAFAQLTLPVGDRLTLSGGARYERFDLTVEDFIRSDAYVAGNVFPAIAVSGGDFDYDQWTFNAGATFDLTAETQLFGGVSQGYSLTDIGGFTRRAGLNSTAEACTAYGVLYSQTCGTQPTFALSYADIAPEPQLVDTYQLGLRHTGATWRGQATAFYSVSDEGVNYDVASNRVRQQREEIWGVEFSGAVDLGPATTLDGLLAWREGKFDSDDDGSVDTWLPNNRIATPLRLVAGLGHHFDSGLFLRGEAVYLGGRDRQAASAGATTDLADVTLVNVSAALPLGSGTLSLAVENLFDEDYVNPTATATRNLPVRGDRRTVTVGYAMTF